MQSGVRELARGSPGNQPCKVPMPAPRGTMRSMDPMELRNLPMGGFLLPGTGHDVRYRDEQVETEVE